MESQRMPGGEPLALRLQPSNDFLLLALVLVHRPSKG
jgi:hypothetical protein